MIGNDTGTQDLLSKPTIVSIVIPCFNEQAVLPLLFQRLDQAIATWENDYEVVLVDDGSTDATWSMLCEMHQKNPRWKAIRLARNFGHQLALWAGLKHATGDVIAVLDADLQDPPELVQSFLRYWAQGYDVVYAVRTKRKEGFFKRSAYFVFYRVLAFLSSIDIPLDSGDFCVVDRRVVEAMTIATEQQPFIRGLRAWVGFRHIGVPYERQERAGGEVKYTFTKLLQLALNGVFSFSSRPLQLATYLGFTVSFFAFLGTLFFILQRVFSQQFEAWGFPFVPGFTAIAVAVLFLGGVQLICIGILGEYVGRIYDNVKGRPQFTVSELRGFRPSDSQRARPTAQKSAC